MKNLIKIVIFIILSVFHLTTYSLSPSFNCEKAKSISEKLICSDDELAQADRDLASIHKTSKAKLQNTVEFDKETLNAWKYRENTCNALRFGIKIALHTIMKNTIM
jgi:uncharacterized protein